MEWALYYRHEKEWSIFPVDSNKKPLIASWREYQKKFPADEEINRWFSDPNTKGIAVVTGVLSGLVVLDIDKGADTTSMELPPTVIAKTGGGGLHHYYKYPRGKNIRNSAGKIRDHVDIRGEGGYIVLPPSLHHSGERYDWVDSLSLDEIEIAEMPESLLISIESKSAATTQEWERVVGGVSQGKRNVSAALIAGKLLQRFPSEEWNTFCWELFVGWNRNNKPPMDEKELRTTFESIAKNELKNKKTPLLLQEWTPPISIMELCKKDFPEKKWIVENIFERGTIGQLSAPPNQWKTWLMWYVAICIASGKNVFGKFGVDKQGVLIVNEEDPERMLKERSLMLLGEAEDLPIYIHAEKGIKLESEVVSRLLEEVKEKNVGVVIFDSLSVIHTADENSAKEIGAVFEQMKRFTREGITVLFTNHHRKKSLKKWEKDDLQEQVRGSTVIGAVISGHITCEEKVQGSDKFIIIRQAKLKGAKKLTPFLVRIKEEEEGNRIDFVYESEHEESLDAATKLKNELYKIMQTSESWFGIQDLKEMVGKSDKPVRDQINVLIEEKQIQKKTRATLIKQGVPVPERKRSSGQEFLYFRLGGEGEEVEEGGDHASFDQVMTF